MVDDEAVDLQLRRESSFQTYMSNDRVARALVVMVNDLISSNFPCLRTHLATWPELGESHLYE